MRIGPQGERQVRLDFLCLVENRPFSVRFSGYNRMTTVEMRA